MVVFPGLQGFRGEIFVWLPAIVFCGMTFPVNVVVVFSFYYLMSNNSFDGIFVFGVVFRGFSEQFWAWTEVKLSS